MAATWPGDFSAVSRLHMHGCVSFLFKFSSFSPAAKSSQQQKSQPLTERALGADGLKQLHVFSTLLRIISVNLRRSGVVPQSRALLCCGYSSHAIFALPFHSSTGLGIALESELHYLLMGVLRENVIMPLFASGANVYSDSFVISLCPQLFLPHQQIHTNITIAEQTIHGVKLTQSSLHYCTDFFLAVC